MTRVLAGVRETPKEFKVRPALKARLCSQKSAWTQELPSILMPSWGAFSWNMREQESYG